jgi:glycosyltransferase involved in cell wall biosynthesis
VLRKILFITTSNLATNPRLVKEIELAMRLGLSCTVVQFKLGNWSDQKTELLKLKYNKIHFIEISATRKPLMNWLKSSFVELFFSRINFKYLNIKHLAYSINKRSYLILKETNNLQVEFDWIIAHNPGSFYPAYILSKRIEAKIGFDIEDYHPGETDNVEKSLRMLKLMNCLLMKANYCSFAAPLIQKEFELKIPNNTNRWFTIINGFPKSEFIEPMPFVSEKIKIVWFSQNITPLRGLEKFINIIADFQDLIELHLIGDLTLSNKVKLLQSNSKIVIHSPMIQKELHRFLSTFHVGLATDLPLNRNRELAITNKLVAYAQAGLFIVSISAKAHNEFLKHSGLSFKIIENEDVQIRQCFEELVEFYKKGKLNSVNQFEIASKFSWESINSELIEVWKE